MKLLSNNPQTVVSASATGIGVLAVWLLSVFGVHVPNEVAVVIAGVISAILFFIGREGLVGVWNLILHGHRHPVNT